MLKAFFTVFITIFVAEIGDKTQLATLLFASDRNVSKWIIFAGASLALVAAAGIGVLVGAQLERFVKPSTLKTIAGIGFIAIGIWTLVSKS
jgi:putative Ca2+/H+ antiporter (TMEM165/GDT1 family)